MTKEPTLTYLGPLGLIDRQEFLAGPPEHFAPPVPTPELLFPGHPRVQRAQTTRLLLRSLLDCNLDPTGILRFWAIVLDTFGFQDLEIPPCFEERVGLEILNWGFEGLRLGSELSCSGLQVFSRGPPADEVAVKALNLDYHNRDIQEMLGLLEYGHLFSLSSLAATHILGLLGF